jgi:hypothetical protein
MQHSAASKIALLSPTTKPGGVSSGAAKPATQANRAGAEGTAIPRVGGFRSEIPILSLANRAIVV